jgi:hypothetical protein
LCAFATARRAKKEEGVISHHHEYAYTAEAGGSTSTVIPSEIACQAVVPRLRDEGWREPAE